MQYSTIAQLHNRLFVPTDQPIEHQPLEPNFRPTKFTSAPSSVITRSLFTRMTDRPTNQSNDQRLNFFSKRPADRLTDRPAHNSSVVSSTVFPTDQIHLFSLITVSLFTRLADRPTNQPVLCLSNRPADRPTHRPAQTVSAISFKQMVDRIHHSPLLIPDPLSIAPTD